MLAVERVNLTWLNEPTTLVIVKKTKTKTKKKTKKKAKTKKNKSWGIEN